MKVVLVLMACLTISVLHVNSEECEIQKLENFQPEKLSGSWYLLYADPDIFKIFDRVSENLKFDGDKYTGNLTATFVKVGKPETHDITMSIDGSTTDVQYEGHSEFNGKYEVLTTDYTTYLVKQGRPRVTNSEPLTLVFVRERCPNDEAIEAAQDSVETQCMPITDFRHDGTLDDETTMLIMKVAIVLITCFTINLLEVHCQQCEPEKMQDIDLEKLSGTWYVHCIKPSILKNLNKAKEEVKFDGEKLAGNITFTFTDVAEPEIHYSTWRYDGNMLDVRTDGLSQFDGKYEIATDYTTYLIKQGYPEATSPELLIAVLMRERCPTDDATRIMQEAIKKQCLSLSSLIPDPILKPECPAN